MMDRRGFFGRLVGSCAAAPLVTSAKPVGATTAAVAAPGSPAGDIVLDSHIKVPDPKALDAFVQRDVLPAIERAIRENHRGWRRALLRQLER